MIREIDGIKPDIHPTAFVHETAEIIGRVRLGPKVSIWPYAVLRGDIEEISIGEGTNIQDNTVIHTDHGIPTILGNWISVGHSAVLHGCRVENRGLVGMGAILLNNVVVEEECLIAAGAVLSPGTRVPKRSLVMGVPGKVVRPLNADDIKHIYRNADNYVGYTEKYVKTSRVVPR